MKDEVNVSEFATHFPDEKACVAFLEGNRWGNGGPVSPFTGGAAYLFAGKPGLYRCKDTRQNFSVRHGTIFEESRLPLRKWFFAIFLLTSLKKGANSAQIAKYLGVTQKTAWLMLQRIRYAVEHETFKKAVPEVAQGNEVALEKRPKLHEPHTAGSTIFHL